MENATKALLIAAAVLIAIILIGLGVGILSSSNDSSKQAGQTANAMSNSADVAVNNVKDGLTALNGLL